jgi:hypothetical protein
MRIGVSLLTGESELWTADAVAGLLGQTVKVTVGDREYRGEIVAVGQTNRVIDVTVDVPDATVTGLSAPLAHLSVDLDEGIVGRNFAPLLPIYGGPVDVLPHSDACPICRDARGS